MSLNMATSESVKCDHRKSRVINVKKTEVELSG